MDECPAKCPVVIDLGKEVHYEEVKWFILIFFSTQDQDADNGKRPK